MTICTKWKYPTWIQIKSFSFSIKRINYTVTGQLFVDRPYSFNRRLISDVQLIVDRQLINRSWIPSVPQIADIRSNFHQISRCPQMPVTTSLQSTTISFSLAVSSLECNSLSFEFNSLSTALHFETSLPMVN